MDKDTRTEDIEGTFCTGVQKDIHSGRLQKLEDMPQSSQ